LAAKITTISSLPKIHTSEIIQTQRENEKEDAIVNTAPAPELILIIREMVVSLIKPTEKRWPLEPDRELEEAVERAWILPSSVVKQLIGVKPLGEAFTRGRFRFVHPGKIGAEAGWASGEDLMQLFLTYLIEILLIAFIAMMTLDFIAGLVVLKQQSAPRMLIIANFTHVGARQCRAPTVPQNRLLVNTFGHNSQHLSCMNFHCLIWLKVNTLVSAPAKGYLISCTIA
jgi:hypothetical protein